MRLNIPVLLFSGVALMLRNAFAAELNNKSVYIQDMSLADYEYLSTLSPTRKPSKVPTFKPSKKPTTCKPSKTPTTKKPTTFKPTKALTFMPTRRPIVPATRKPTRKHKMG